MVCIVLNMLSLCACVLMSFCVMFRCAGSLLMFCDGLNFKRCEKQWIISKNVPFSLKCDAMECFRLWNQTQLQVECAFTYMDKHLFNLSDFGALPAPPIRWNSVDAMTFDSHDSTYQFDTEMAFTLFGMKFFFSNFIDNFLALCVFAENYYFFFSRKKSDTVRFFPLPTSLKCENIANAKSMAMLMKEWKKERNGTEGRTFRLFDIRNVIKWLWVWLRITIRIVCHTNNVSFVIEEWIPFIGDAVDSDTSTANKSQRIMWNSANWRR